MKAGEQPKLYGKADLEKLCESEHYGKHLLAMTSEKLHSKSDIAIELAHRDYEIQKLEQTIDYVLTKLKHHHTSRSGIRRIIEEAEKQLSEA